MAEAHDTRQVVQSLAANLAIALAKGGAAIFTGSGALLAETLHSVADCANQILLLVGVQYTKRPPTPRHPLGYGRALYFWSFMVALLLFSGGGLFSIHEGVHKLEEPGTPDHLWVGVAICLFSLTLESATLVGNIREINRRRKGQTFRKYLVNAKDSDLIVLFAENSADVFGLLLGLLSMGVTQMTGDARFDAYGSLSIGVLLVSIAVFLGWKVQSLLLGEAADPEIEQAVHDIAHDHPYLETVLECLTIQQGPGEVLVALKLCFDPTLTSVQVCDVINEFEVSLRARCPEARWVFVEPDLEASLVKPETVRGGSAPRDLPRKDLA